MTSGLNWDVATCVTPRSLDGIHGTPFPESIGTRATEGCIRLRNEDITDLKGRVRVGTTVIILPDPPALP